MPLVSPEKIEIISLTQTPGPSPVALHSSSKDTHTHTQCGKSETMKLNNISHLTTASLPSRT